jgi:hypothetical protein
VQSVQPVQLDEATDTFLEGRRKPQIAERLALGPTRVNSGPPTAGIERSHGCRAVAQIAAEA